MPKVYVVQKQMRWDDRSQTFVQKFDLSSAEKYGELEFLLSPTANPFTPDLIIEDLRAGLVDFTEDDYLLLIGNPCLIGFATSLAAEASGGPVKLLQWNGRERRYVVVEADLS